MLIAAKRRPFEFNLNGLTNYMEDVLVDAQSERRARKWRVDGEIAWSLYERLVACETINLLRRRLQRSAIDIEDVKSAESASLGSNFTRSFAQACAKLVLRR